MGLFSLADVEYMFWNGIRNGTIGTIGAKGDPGGITLGTQLSNTVSLDTIQTSGVYRLTSTYSGLLAYNYPRDNDTGVLYVDERVVGQTVIQRWYSITQNTRMMYMRSMITGVWSPWRCFPYSRVDTTAGRAIYQWDDVNNREQLIYGDTGLRNLEAEVINGWTAGIFKIRRIGYEVTAHFYNVNPAGQTGASMWAIPVGFRPIGAVTNQGIITVGGNITTTFTDILPTTGGTTAQTFVHVFKWTTADVWPTVLPGTASGTIPNL